MAFDFASMMNDPQMQYGLALLGAARSSTSPFTDAQKQLFALQKQKEDIALMQSQSQRMQQQTVGERQQNAIALANFLMTRGLANRVQNLKQLGGPGLPPEQVPPATQGLPQPLLDLMGSQGFTSMNTTGATQAALQAQPPPDTGGVNIGNGGQPIAPPAAGAPMPGGPAVPQSVQPPDVTQAAMPPQQPQVPVDQYGTPTALLDSLRQVESSGNPHAIGPNVPGMGNALGQYQFMPSTVKMLKDQGINFNPMIPEQARDAASQYIQMLLKQNGGDMQKALAAYGGFKTKDPSAYVGKVLAGAGALPQAAAPQGAPPVTAGPQAAPGATIPNEGLPLIQAGSMMGLVNPAAGEALIKGGQAMAPTSQTANSYRIDPATGKMIYLPDPEKVQQTSNITPNAQGMTPADVSGMNKETAGKMATQLGESRALIREVPNQIAALQQAKASIPSEAFTGPAAERKITALKFLNSVIPGGGLKEDDLANADVFRSAINQALLGSVKTTGGRMSVPEMNRMESNFGSLTTNPKAMQDIANMMIERYRNTLAQHNDISGQYNQAMGKNFHLDYTLRENPPSQTGPVGRQNPTAMSLDDYLKKYRK